MYTGRVTLNNRLSLVFFPKSNVYCLISNNHAKKIIFFHDLIILFFEIIFCVVKNNLLKLFSQPSDYLFKKNDVLENEYAIFFY